MNDQTEAGRARRLAELLVTQPDEAECARCLDELEAYVAAQLAGEAYTARFPAVARHLDQCVACAESYGLLYEALAGAAAPAEPAAIPAADLAFLEPGAAGPLSPDELRRRRAAARLQELTGAALSQAPGRLRVRLSEALLAAAAALRAASPAPALRSGEPAPIHELRLAAPAPGVDELLILAYPAAAADRCDLRVQLALVGREWPDLAGVVVTLRAPGLERQLVTDAWGEARAADIPRDTLAGLELEVVPAGG